MFEANQSCDEDEQIYLSVGIDRGRVLLVGDHEFFGDPVNTVFRLQNLTKSFPNGILISENTLRAARTRPHVGQIKTSADLTEELGDMKVYELLGEKTDKPYVVAAR